MSPTLTLTSKRVLIGLLFVCLVLEGPALLARASSDVLAAPASDFNDALISIPFMGEVDEREIIWSGAAGDGAWSNPENWAGSRVPGQADTVRLLGSTPNARVDAAFDGRIAGLYLDADYTGTLHLERDLWVQGDLEMAGGILQGENTGLNVNGTARVSGGVLVTPVSAAMNVVTLEIAAPGVVRLGANSKLNISGSGQPLRGDGLLDTTTYRPNSVEYTGAATTDLMTAGPAAGSGTAAPAGFARAGALALNAGDDFLGSAVIDPTGAYAYFGDWTTTGHVFKVNLSTFTHVGTLTLNEGEERPLSAVIDPTGTYAYFGTYKTFPTQVVKVNLANFTRVGALAMNTDDGFICSAVIDPTGAYAYFGTFYPGRVLKVNLTAFSREGALTLNAGEEALWSAIIDSAGEFAYFGAATSPGIVVKVNLTTFAREGALTLDIGEDNLHSGVIDPAGAYAYFGTETSPGIVVKVNLTTFTRSGALALNAGEDNLWAAVIDPAGAYAYFGTNNWPGPGIVVQVDLAAFTRNGSLSLEADEASLISAVIDPDGEYAYFATFTVPGRVVKIGVGGGNDLSIFLPLVVK